MFIRLIVAFGLFFNVVDMQAAMSPVGNYRFSQNPSLGVLPTVITLGVTGNNEKTVAPISVIPVGEKKQQPRGLGQQPYRQSLNINTEKRVVRKNHNLKQPRSKN